MMIARSIVNGVGHAPERDDICIADSFEHPNRCDWRCSHDREWCIRRVRPMRYKGCHQAHNAQVVICALFTTRNSLKLQGWRKAFSPIRKVRAISQKLYPHSGTTAVKSPERLTQHRARHPAVSSLGGLRTPAPVCAAPPSWGRHPKTFTKDETARAVERGGWRHSQHDSAAGHPVLV